MARGLRREAGRVRWRRPTPIIQPWDAPSQARMCEFNSPRGEFIGRMGRRRPVGLLAPRQVPGSRPPGAPLDPAIAKPVDGAHPEADAAARRMTRTAGNQRMLRVY